MCFDGARYRLIGKGRIGNIGRDASNASRRDFCTDHVSSLLERLGIAVNERDGCALLAEQQGAGPTDSCCATRDQC
jgi:hypothetical protein